MAQGRTVGTDYENSRNNNGFEYFIAFISAKEMELFVLEK